MTDPAPPRPDPRSTLSSKKKPKKGARFYRKQRSDTKRSNAAQARAASRAELKAGESLGTRGRRRPRLAMPRHLATTAHSCTLYPWGVHEGSGSEGVYLGTDMLAGTASFVFDLLASYHKSSTIPGWTTNTNMLIMGEPGQGKSALVKCMLYRQHAVYGDRFVCIVDPKGEYKDIAEVLGLTIIKLSPGGMTQVNPLHTTDTVNAVRTRYEVVDALLATELGRALHPVEDVALWTAIELLSGHDTQPTLHDLVGMLEDLPDEIVEATRRPRAAAETEINAMAHVAASLVRRSLRGMFDGVDGHDTHVDPYGPGLLLDLSAVLSDEHALPLVMTAAIGWLKTLLTTPDKPAILILDEAWATMGLATTARFMQSLWKLGRTYGVANIALLHKAADPQAQSDDGSATGKIAAGIIADTGVRVSFAQKEQSLLDSASLLGWSPTEQEQILKQTRGQSFWKIGKHAFQLDHHIPPGGTEARLCNTDQALGTTGKPG